MVKEEGGRCLGSDEEEDGSCLDVDNGEVRGRLGVEKEEGGSYLDSDKENRGGGCLMKKVSVEAVWVYTRKKVEDTWGRR